MPQLAAIGTGPIIGAVGLILICLVLYYIVRMMKGKVEIELPKRGYNSGEEISGSVTLTSRKELKMNRFFVALIGYERIKRLNAVTPFATRRVGVRKIDIAQNTLSREISGPPRLL